MVHKYSYIGFIVTKGDFSYGLYIYGCIIQNIIHINFGCELPLMYKIPLSLALTFPFAFFSWKFIESKALKLKLRLWGSGSVWKSEFVFSKYLLIDKVFPGVVFRKQLKNPKHPPAGGHQHRKSGKINEITFNKLKSFGWRLQEPHFFPLL